MTTTSDEQLDKFIANLWFVMTRMIKKTWQMGGRLVEEHELTQPQLYALILLKDNGPMTMGELSDLLAVTHGVATRMVDRLLKKGMVERRRHESDRRVVIISLTGLGERATVEAVADAMSMIRGAFKSVSQCDREEYLALLGRIEDAQDAGAVDKDRNGGPKP